ncbi:MAG TPA: Ku protein [Nitrososphaeraceae archaeon]|jgi:DNA end-binding protein Ku|nr:Ku protein [Nitrososphaeraceae archaeon]
MAARTIWKGSISFGLVNIPVQVFVATQKDEFSSFNQLDEKGHKIKYKKWCPIEEREIPWSEIKKGYEITKDNYVVLEKEDLENIKLKTTHTIEINEFIDSEEFDPLFIEKTYYIGPDTGMTKKKKNTSPPTSKAYSLFVKILNETNKVAIGKVVLRDKEHLVALRSYQRGLIMHQLKYLDEIKPMDEVEGISSVQQPKVEDKELSLGKTLVDNLTNEQFDIGKYSDTYSKEVKKLIEAKSKGQKVTIGKEEDKAEDTTNLLEALKASIDLKSKPHRQKKN